mmetsp:Transcript_8193/g.16360  ORF Transcript_8193/g.16360 Transcript_8193/m.16360 type:complete len:178 (+) Transcript_8193:246-779(+)
MRLIRWTPSVEDMGKTYSVCHHTLWNTSSVPADMPTSRCIHFAVERCRYCVQGGETLLSIAHALGTDWLQLWGANADLDLPVDGIPANSVIRIGPVHTVQTTQKLSALAVSLATTEELLRAVNRDLPEEQVWVGEGRELCVLPGVCDADVAADGSGRVATEALPPAAPPMPPSPAQA